MHTHVAHQAHTLSIQLTGRIWGSVCQAAHVNHRPQQDRTMLSLLSHLSTLFHNLSFPAFTLMFS